MKFDSGLQRLIYEYYEARILSGYYTCGDRLPSITKISADFNMAFPTIRAALSSLEKNAFIQVEAKKRARVIYETSPSELRRHAAAYFVCREEGILDAVQSRKLFFGPLLDQGRSRWTEAVWETLRRSLEDPLPDAVAIPVEFDYLCLHALDNGLLLNLYSEMIRYMRFPYLLSRKEDKFDGELTAGDSKERIATVLKYRSEAAYKSASEKLLDFIRTARQDYMLEKTEPLAFEWNIYRKRPQIRYTLVSRMIREIISGEYPAGSYLPSLPCMKERYDASLSTMRRTMIIMDGLGITKSYHGKGIRVCMEPSEIDFSNPDIIEGMQLYRQALQMLTWTIRQITYDSMNTASYERRNALAEALQQLRQRRACYCCIEIVLAFIEENSPLSLIRECYKKLKELLAWGYPFVFGGLKQGDLNAEFMEFVTQMEQTILQGDLDKFSDLWLALIEREQQRFETSIPCGI